MVWEMLFERVTMDYPDQELHDYPELHDQHVIEGRRLAFQIIVDWLDDAIDNPIILPSPMWSCGSSIYHIKEDKTNISNLLYKVFPTLATHYRKYSDDVS